MKETTDYLENIMDIVLACRKRNKKIGARLKHFHLNKETMLVKLTGNGSLKIPVLIAENGVSQMTKESIQRIADSFEAL
jgi:predicted nucleotidyltransferase